MNLWFCCGYWLGPTHNWNPAHAWMVIYFQTPIGKPKWDLHSWLPQTNHWCWLGVIYLILRMTTHPEYQKHQTDATSKKTSLVAPQSSVYRLLHNNSNKTWNNVSPIVGSYSSTKLRKGKKEWIMNGYHKWLLRDISTILMEWETHWFWINWMVSALLPTPPAGKTEEVRYKFKRVKALKVIEEQAGVKGMKPLGNSNRLRWNGWELKPVVWGFYPQVGKSLLCTAYWVRKVVISCLCIHCMYMLGLHWGLHSMRSLMRNALGTVLLRETHQGAFWSKKKKCMQPAEP